MPVDARRLIRKMRGGAQAHLIEAADGHCYVVKFLNNPQHRRILVNEWIASVFLRYLGISTPEAAVIRVTKEFLDQNPEVHFQLGTRREPVELGWHFGSRFPGDPARLVIVRRLAAGPARVTDLTAALGLAQSTVSKHLACLRDCGLVTSEPAGRASVFRLAQPALAGMLAAAESVLAATGSAVALCPVYGLDACGQEAP